MVKLVPIKEVLTPCLEKFALERKSYLIYQLWEKEIGKLSQHSRLLGIKKGYLEVEVNSSVALQEFFLRKEEIVQRLNKKIGENMIKDIHFHQQSRG